MQHGLVGVIVLHAIREIKAILKVTMNLSAEVVATIDNITYPWEAVLIVIGAIGLSADEHLSMSQNISITGTAKGIVDSTVAQVYQCVTAYQAFITATIDIFRFSQVFIFCVIRIDGLRGVQVDSRAIGGVECVLAIESLLAYHTQLTAAEYLEGIALVQVHGGAAPDFRLLTVASTKDS